MVFIINSTMKVHTEWRELNKQQIKVFSAYSIEISKSISLVIVVSLLFPKIGGKIDFYAGMIGFFICLVFLIVGIILIKEDT